MCLSCFLVNVFVFFHVLKLRSFNSQFHSVLSVVGYHSGGQEIGKYCPLPEPIRSQDSRIPPAHDERNMKFQYRRYEYLSCNTSVEYPNLNNFGSVPYD